MYGLPKVHKEGVPFRPILSMTGSAYHELARKIDDWFLKPILPRFRRHTVKDSFAFKDKVQNTTVDDTCEMICTDVSSLFTNIPVDETIDIICDVWFRGAGEPPKVGDQSISETSLRQLLNAVSKNVLFVFNGKLFRQKDGLAMGSPLSGSFADIFVGHHERHLLSSKAIQPISYSRYVDDVHIICKRGDSSTIVRMLNAMHPALTFTTDDGDHFLDVRIHRSGSTLETSVYRKPSFTGMYIHYQAYCPKQYKVNLVRNLFNRSRRLCSTSHLTRELAFLRTVLVRNGYPHWFIEKYSAERTKGEEVATAAKKVLRFGIQYVGEASVQETVAIRRAVQRAYPHTSIVPWFRTKKMCRNAPKDPVPPAYQSNLVYSYDCACGASYVGRTERSLGKRISEHIPRWCEAGRSRPRSTKPPSSAITLHHTTSCHHRPCRDSFKIVKVCRSSTELRISEAVQIRLTTPSLCIQKDFVYDCVLIP